MIPQATMKRADITRVALYVFCILHVGGVFTQKVFWKPISSDGVRWMLASKVAGNNMKLAEEKVQTDKGLIKEHPQRTHTIYNKYMDGFWSKAMEDDRGYNYKRSERNVCYMPEACSDGIGFTDAVQALRDTIAQPTDIRERRLATNCYNYELDTPGVMIASRIGQFPSLLKWFQLISENYGSDIVSLVWSTNSTFDNIMGCLREMQDECPCDSSRITHNSYIVSNCRIPPPTPGQSNQQALMLNSLDEFIFILDSVDYYISKMKFNSHEGTPLCSNSS